MAKIDDSVKKKVPELRFKGFTDDWEERKLGDEVRIVMGQSPNSENYTDDPNDYILVQGNADMKNGRVFPRVWTTQVTKQAEKDDLILSVRAPVGDIGKTAYDVVIGRGVAAIKGNEFIFQNLGKMKSDGYWTRYSTGSTFESINSTDIKEAIISVPTIEEQNKIGSFFKQLDNTIALHQRKLDLLKEQKKGYLQKMFPKNGAKVPELRFAGFADDWEERKLIDVKDNEDRYSYTGGPFGSDLKSSDYTEIGVRIIQLQNIGDGKFVNDYKIYTSEEKARSLNSNLIYPGEIIIAKMADPLARATILPKIEPKYLMASDGIRLKISTDYFDNYYILTLINSDVFRKEALNNSTGTTRKRIGLVTLGNLPMMIPSFEEQQKIGSFFKQLDETIDLHQRKLDLLKEQKKGFLQKMFV
ncbi:restriction endonuclease subunit S [Lactococcus petauri]|uniref:restriction endonuclease subunit S n=2 Tax=Lactococcus petauri TaxID=1940789 RepID=UPI0038546A5B